MIEIVVAGPRLAQTLRQAHLLGAALAHYVLVQGLKADRHAVPALVATLVRTRLLGVLLAGVLRLWVARLSCGHAIRSRR